MLTIPKLRPMLAVPNMVAAVEAGDGVFSNSVLLWDRRVRGNWFQEGWVEANLDRSGGVWCDDVVVVVERNS